MENIIVEEGGPVKGSLFSEVLRMCLNKLPFIEIIVRLSNTLVTSLILQQPSFYLYYPANNSSHLADPHSEKSAYGVLTYSVHLCHG